MAYYFRKREVINLEYRPHFLYSMRKKKNYGSKKLLMEFGDMIFLWLR